MIIQCSACSGQIEVPDQQVQQGGTIYCPHCHSAVPLTGAAAVASPAAQAAPAALPAEPAPAASSPGDASTAPAPAAKGQGALIAGISVIGGIVICGLVLAIVLVLRGDGDQLAAPPDGDGSHNTGDANGAGDSNPPHSPTNVGPAQPLGPEKADLEKAAQELEEENRRLREKIQELEEKLNFVNQLRQSDFVLVDAPLAESTDLAVGLKRSGAVFSVVCKSTGSLSALAQAACIKYHIPRVSGYADLAREVLDKHEVGKTIDDSLAQRVQSFWKQHRYAPPAPNQNALFITLRPQDSQRDLLGFYLGAKDDEVALHSFGTLPSVLSRESVLPHTARVGNDETMLSSDQIDLVDYAALKVGQMLATPQDAPTYVNVAVRVNTENLQAVLSDSKVLRMSWVEEFLELMSRELGTPVSRNALQDSGSAVAQYGQSLEAAVLDRLAKLGIRVIAQQDAAALLRQAGENEAEQLSDPQYGKLLCATHLFVMELDAPQAEGGHRLSMQLQGVNGERLVWSGQGDRHLVRPHDEAPPARFLLESGSLKIAHFGPADQEPASPTASTAAIPQPAQLPPLDSKRMNETSRLVYVEGTEGDARLLRDVFSLQAVPFPASAVAKLEDVQEFDELSPLHRLRYLVWRVAQVTLPSAARVMSAEEGKAAKVDIGSAAGVRPGQKLLVLRAEEKNSSKPGVQATRLLPLRLEVTKVEPDHSQVLIDDSGLDELWPSDEAVELGDLAMQVGNRTSKIAVLPMQPDKTLIDKPTAGRMQTMTPAQVQALNDATETTAAMLAAKLRAALVSLNVECAAEEAISGGEEALEAARAAGATHLITGGIAPAISVKENGACSVSLKVYDVQSGRLINRMLGMRILNRELQAWQP